MGSATVSRASVLAKGRAFTEASMTDTCVIRRAGGSPVLNEETGQYEPSFVDVYSGPCKVRFITSTVSEQDYQSQTVVEQQVVLSLPVEESTPVVVNDIAEITTSQTNVSAIGKTFRIAGLFDQTYATARRFPVEVVS